MDAFALKKLLSTFLQPLSLALESLTLGLILLAASYLAMRAGRLRRLRKWGWRLGSLLLVGGALFLYLGSTATVAEGLIYALERQYPPPAEDDEAFRKLDPDFIVVLAGGWRDLKHAPLTSRVLPPTHARVTEGVRLAGLFPRAKLAFTGTPREVEGMAGLAEVMGVARERCVLEPESRDTDDHPRFLKPILGESRFLLVTSGSHLPRAVALFRGQGLDPVPVPADLWSYPDYPGRRVLEWDRLIPKPAHLRKTEVAMHELLGSLYSRLSGHL